MKGKLETLFNRLPFGPLNGVLVVEIGQHVSGPMAAEELARQGALVIKIEKSEGDPSRHYLSKESFTSLNAAKISMIVHKNDSHYQAVLALADVIIDNRSPDAKEKDTILQGFLKAADKKHPVIFCSIVGYDSQANKSRRALDVSVQSETGMAMTNAPHPNFPLKVGFTVIDMTTAIKAASYISAHLFYLNNKTLPKNHIKNNVLMLEVSMAKVSAMLQTGQYLNYAVNKKETNRDGNRDVFLSPFSFYKTLDGMISLAVIDEHQFKRLCVHVLQREDFIEHYSTNTIRLESDEFEKKLAAILAEYPSHHWLTLCQKNNIPCTKVNSIKETLQEPFAQSFFTHTQQGTLIMANTYSSSFFKDAALHNAPLLNEHQGLIRTLITYHNKMGFKKFDELWQVIKNNKHIQKKSKILWNMIPKICSKL